LLKSFKTYRLKASSLLESVIAITVLSICVLIAVKLYSSVLASSYSYNYLRANIALNGLADDIRKTRNLEEGLITYDTFKIVKKVDFETENIGTVLLQAQMKKDTIVKKYLIYKFNEE